MIPMTTAVTPMTQDVMILTSHADNHFCGDLAPTRIYIGVYMATKKIGRDAGTGKFKTVKAAQADKKGSVVETIKTVAKPKPKKK